LKNPSLKSQTTIRENEKFKVFIWALFDFANTSYSIVVVTFLYAVYFKQTIVSSQPIGDFYWSIGTSASMLITAMISPVLGAIADYSAGKKRFLLFFTATCIISTSLLYFTNKGDILLGLILFVIANVGYEAGIVFYDSFLPEITTPKNFGRVSGYGFALGYLGSLTTLAITFPFIKANMIRATFPVAAMVFLVFAIPLFVFLKDTRKQVVRDESFFKIGISRVINTITHLRSYKNLTLFLLAFFCYIEGVNTVIFFSGNYASTTLHFTMEELIVFFLIVQTTAIVGSIVFGLLADSYGQKKSLILSLIIWIVTIILAYVSSDENSILIKFVSTVSKTESSKLVIYFFYLVGLLAGGVMGATQSTSRSMMSKLTPFERKTEFFGFYSFFGKSSAIVGPLVFGYVSFVSGDQRLAILTINLFFIVGLIILTFVKDPKTEP
jgi:MFS transporter, UMF1 family